MRTIKFRGKRIDNGEWVYGNLYELPSESGNVCMILTTDNIHEDNSIKPQYHLAFTLWKDLFVVDSSTIGQLTGLLDKSGKEIYEGDIVRFTRWDGNLVTGLVKWDDDCNPCMCIEFKTEYKQTDWEYDFIKCGTMVIEVVGNIHDNPELIKD